jgi:hypothetical protein
MSLAILIPYRPDSEHRERIFATTQRMWKETGLELVTADDGLDGLFGFARAINRARARTGADCLLIYNTDALPLPVLSLGRIEQDLRGGVPWVALFDGQQRFTPEQTERLIAGEDPQAVGPAAGQVCLGREALLGIRADVFDDLRGMDERFVGWGPEDVAFHRVLSLLYPQGIDTPAHGLFQSLWHPDVPRTRWDANVALWRQYRRKPTAATMRHWYLSRP